MRRRTIILLLLICFLQACNKRNDLQQATLKYAGIEFLKQGRDQLAVATLGNKFIFAGGEELALSSAIDVLEVGNDNVIIPFTKYKYDFFLSQPRSNLIGGTAENTVFFAGGKTITGASDVIDILKLNENDTLKPVVHKLKLKSKRYDLASASVGNIILFAGGYDGSNYYDDIDVIKVNNDGTVDSVHNNIKLKSKRYGLVATRVGNFVVFAGGTKDNNIVAGDIDIFKVNTDGTIQKIEHTIKLSQARQSFATTVIGNKIFFAGGYSNMDDIDIVEIDNNGNPKLIPNNLKLSTGDYGLAAATIGNKIIVCGGRNWRHEIDIFELGNDGVIRKASDNLRFKLKRGYLVAAAIGNTAAFAGGGYQGGYSNVIELYQFTK